MDVYSTYEDRESIYDEEDFDDYEVLNEKNNDRLVEYDYDYSSSVDEEENDEDELVFFMKDSEDDDDDDSDNNAESLNCTRSPIRQLSPSLIAKMTEANVGRLKWLEQTPPDNSVNVELTEEDLSSFPPLSQSEPDQKKQVRRSNPQKKSPSKNKRTPVRMRIDFVRDGPYEIKFVASEQHVVSDKTKNKPKKDKLIESDQKDKQEPKICRSIFNKTECLFGDKCKYSHELPLCRAMENGNLCMRGSTCRFRHIPICQTNKCEDKKCALFHPSKEDVARVRGMKTRLCKYVLQVDETTGKCSFSGKCPSGDACKFAHTMAQVKDAVEPCRLKNNCKLVKIVTRLPSRKLSTKPEGNKVVGKTVYKNVPGGPCCWRLHPDEVIANFVARTSIKKKE